MSGKNSKTFVRTPTYREIGVKIRAAVFWIYKFIILKVNAYIIERGVNASLFLSNILTYIQIKLWYNIDTNINLF